MQLSLLPITYHTALLFPIPFRVNRYTARKDAYFAASVIATIEMLKLLTYIFDNHLIKHFIVQKQLPFCQIFSSLFIFALSKL